MLPASFIGILRHEATVVDLSCECDTTRVVAFLTLVSCFVPSGGSRADGSKNAGNCKCCFGDAILWCVDENESFDVEVSIEEEEDEEEGFEFEQEEMTDTENLKYLLELIKKSDNTYNREEIKGYRAELWDAIY